MRLSIDMNLSLEVMSMQSLDEMVNELPAELRQEVFDFVEFLLERRMRKC